MEYHATLPVPPSTNNLFATYRGRRIQSRAYQDWRLDAGRVVAWPRLSDDARNQIRWAVRLTAFGLSRRRDVDNLIKPVVDLIVAHTGLRDNWLEEISARRSAVEREGPCVYVALDLLEDAT